MWLDRELRARYQAVRTASATEQSLSALGRLTSGSVCRELRLVQRGEGATRREEL